MAKNDVRDAPAVLAAEDSAAVAPVALAAAAAVARSNRRDVRNPMLQDPEMVAEWAKLPPEARDALVGFLNRLSKSWRAKGDVAWAPRKPPMAAYWRVNAVNARHLALSARAGVQPAAGADLTDKQIAEARTRRPASKVRPTRC